MAGAIIQNIKARELLDSRGDWTLEVETTITGGYKGRFIVPAGASKGKMEAVALYDSNKRKTLGLAIENVGKIADNVCGKMLQTQKELDDIMCDLDGTEYKSHLGANAILGVSMSFAIAASKQECVPLYRYISNIAGTKPSMPVPLVNVINGGAHSNNGLAFQEFMITPSGKLEYKEGLMIICDVFKSLKTVLKRKNLSLAVGDEGGFAPAIASENEALELLASAIQESKHVLGRDVFIALDVAANHFYVDGHYVLNNKHIDGAQLANHYVWLMKQYPIVSIEDPLAEEDIGGWKNITYMLGDIIQIVGDDVFVTNSKILQKGIEAGIANAVLLKLNQVGTLSETIDTALLAMRNNYKIVVSHRSGETEDVSIAHLAVGLGCRQIKTGSVSRSERTAKYNELLRITEKI